MNNTLCPNFYSELSDEYAGCVRSSVREISFDKLKNISAYSKNFHIPKFLVVEEIKLFCYVHKILLLLIFYLKIPTLDTSSLKKEIKTKYSTCPYFHSQNSESKKKSKPQKTHTKFFSHLHSVSQNFHSQNHQRKTRSSGKK